MAVVPLWKPQFLHEKYTIGQLQDPLGVMGGADAATLIVRSALMQQLPAGAAAALRGLRLGNEEVSRLDHLISCEGMDALDAARRRSRGVD